MTSNSNTDANEKMTSAGEKAGAAGDRPPGTTALEIRVEVTLKAKTQYITLPSQPTLGKTLKRLYC